MKKKTNHKLIPFPSLSRQCYKASYKIYYECFTWFFLFLVGITPHSAEEPLKILEVQEEEEDENNG